MRALAHPRLGPPAAARSPSNVPQRPALLPPALPFPAARLRLRRLPELSPPATRHRGPMHPHDATVAPGGAGGCSFPELTCPADFAAIAAPGGRISVVGFGSLLSERSARSTFPDLEGFRVAALRGFRRVFAHAAPIFFERGIAVEATKVVPEGLDGVLFTNQAVVCARYSDEEYFKERCQGSKEIYNQRYGRFNIDKIWRDDILPCRLYLRHCVLAAKNLGEPAYSNFLDHTYLGDRKTTIREYLDTTGAGILEEEPPESLKSRYSG
ncbi:hypothetical protein GQ55_3G305000 [Panicum hallii var. hallii]|uniref:Uncharacterized protein n=1 Tax=Panicum hallii var. hallii TaxID=1504633 RepID=A0A2T7EEZ5_9POAL|nr:hypothetical protein GQ55_3G305000 [Panicum hallii var. hallii]